jgi:hypothetical protein
MSTNGKKKNEQFKNSSEKDTNINSNNQKINFIDSPNTDDEKDKPVHFNIEYDKQNLEYQIESLPEVNEAKIQPPNQNSSNKKEKEFIIEKNNQSNEKQINNLENKQNNQYYDLLNVDNNFDDYYYYINNNNNEKNNEEDEEEPKRVINFATQTYQGRIDPVKLKQRYNNYWQNQSKSRQKYKKKMDALKKVFNPYGYKNVVNKYKRRVSSQYNTRRTLNDNDRLPFDNTKQPLPKQSYLEVPFDYGINDPNYGKEDPINYNRKKMIKLRMLKQPLKYYYPYTNENLINKKGFKYQ